MAQNFSEIYTICSWLAIYIVYKSDYFGFRCENLSNILRNGIDLFEFCLNIKVLQLSFQMDLGGK